MNKQSKALLMADILESWKGVVSNEAAAELRRLNEVNAELVATLTMVLDRYHFQKMLTLDQEEAGYAAIAKATGEQQ